MHILKIALKEVQTFIDLDDELLPLQAEIEVEAEGGIGAGPREAGQAGDLGCIGPEGQIAEFVAVDSKEHTRAVQGEGACAESVLVR